jgi:ssDNA-binding Zn-finger/Zn-ribbon topoisomerase 1
VAELLDDGDLREHVETIGEISERHRCPACRGRTIRRTQGRYGAFWACSNYPLCDGKLDTCDRCREGALVAGDGSRAPFRCAACGHAVERCPRCAAGRLVERTSKHGPFFACSRWDGGAGCTYTRNIIGGI